MFLNCILKYIECLRVLWILQYHFLVSKFCFIAKLIALLLISIFRWQQRFQWVSILCSQFGTVKIIDFKYFLWSRTLFLSNTSQGSRKKDDDVIRTVFIIHFVLLFCMYILILELQQPLWIALVFQKHKKEDFSVPCFLKKIGVFTLPKNTEIHLFKWKTMLAQEIQSKCNLLQKCIIICVNQQLNKLLQYVWWI